VLERAPFLRHIFVRARQSREVQQEGEFVFDVFDRAGDEHGESRDRAQGFGVVLEAVQAAVVGAGDADRFQVEGRHGRGERINGADASGERVELK
jgi:hypothetical protein